MSDPELKLPTLDDILFSPIPEPDWVVPRFLARGDVAILGGPPYSGKSWIMAELALSFASGHSAFNYSPAQAPQRVLWIDEENSREESWTRIREVVAAHRLTPADLADTFRHPIPRQQFNFRSARHLAALDRMVASYKPAWIFLDSLTAVAAFREENASAESRRFYRDFLIPLTNLGCGVLLIHHNRKPGQVEEGQYGAANPGDFNNLRGSGDIPAACDSVLMVWRKDAQVFVHSSKARRDPEHGENPPKDLVLSFDKPAWGGRRPVVSALALPMGHKSKNLREGVLACLTATPDISHDQLYEAVSNHLGVQDVNRKSLRNRVNDLVDEGLVISTESPDDRRRCTLRCS